MNSNHRLSSRNSHNVSFNRTTSIPLIINRVRNHNKIAKTSLKVFNCSNELNRYKCLKCDYQIPFRVDLKRHVCSSNLHDIDFVKTFICKNCDFQTSSCLVLDRHIYYDCKNAISDCDQKLLEKCENDDESKKNLQYCFETEIYNGDENIVIKNELYCGRCSYKTELKKNLQKHIYKEHYLFTERSNVSSKSNNDRCTIVGMKWFQCKNCLFQTRWKRSLEKHILVKHTAPEYLKWFQCSYCTYKTIREDYLKQHILLKHTAPEKMQCSYCSYETNQVCYLRKHIRLEHKFQI